MSWWLILITVLGSVVYLLVGIRYAAQIAQRIFLTGKTPLPWVIGSYVCLWLPSLVLTFVWLPFTLSVIKILES